jgi:hypothetical protein
MFFVNFQDLITSIESLLFYFILFLFEFIRCVCKVLNYFFKLMIEKIYKIFFSLLLFFLTYKRATLPLYMYIYNDETNKNKLNKKKTFF